MGVRRGLPGFAASILVWSALLVTPESVAAQGTGSASPLLPPGHWAVQAAARVEAMGLAPEYLPAQGAVPRAAVAEALRRAAQRAAERYESPAAESGMPQPRDARAHAVAATTQGWWDRFRMEFHEFAADSAAPIAPAAFLGGHAGAGLQVRRGAAGPGTDEFLPDRTGADPLEDLTQAVLAVEAAVAIGDWAAAHARTAVGTDESKLVRGEMVVGLGKLRASIGRAEVGWGVGRGGGVVFSGSVPLDRVEIMTAAPVRLPGWLRLLGPFAFQSFAGPLPDDRHPGAPWLLGGTASIRPISRLTLSAHRGLVAGGDGVSERMGADELFEALIGKNVVGVNQIASTSFRLRLPTERIVPLAIYCEWGAEDSAGAPFDAPGLVCGGAAASLPAIPGLALGVEHAQLGARPINGPPWYRHHMFPGNWAMDDAPLGHPLGGEGRQWLVYSELSAPAGLEIDASVFRRTRTGENLYVPGRGGVSRGLAMAASWGYHGGAELRFGGSHEDGDGWTETHIEIMSRIFF